MVTSLSGSLFYWRRYAAFLSDFKKNINFPIDIVPMWYYIKTMNNTNHINGGPMPKLNYTPNKNYPLIISKPSASHKNFFIYEEDELDPVSSSRFSTVEKALDWVKKYFPTYRVLIHDEY